MRDSKEIKELIEKINSLSNVDLNQTIYDLSISLMNVILKNGSNDLTILEKILDFSEKYDIQPELIGDIISENKIIKDLLLNELKNNKIFKNNTKNKIMSLFE